MFKIDRHTNSFVAALCYEPFKPHGAVDGQRMTTGFHGVVPFCIESRTVR